MNKLLDKYIYLLETQQKRYKYFKEKGKLRTTIIGGNEYKWIVDEKEVRIYDKDKKLFRVEKSRIYSITDYDGYEDNQPDWGSVRPRMVDIWIKNNIIS